jgi:HEAT repeat protein
MSGLLLCLIVAGCERDHSGRLLAELRSADVESRRAAARELGQLKPALPEAQAALEAAVADDDKEVRRLACFALGELGSADVALLTRALQDAELSVQLAAAYALLKLDARNQAAMDVLSQAMLMGDGGVIVAVTKAGPNAAWAVPTLTQLLRDRRPGIRRLAAEGLGKIGPAAQPAFRLLHDAQRDPDDRVRAAAKRAIQAIQDAAK